MAAEITVARERKTTSLRNVRNAEGRVVGREVAASTKGLNDPVLAIQPFTQFMEKAPRRLEAGMPLKRNAYVMESGNTLTVGISQNGDTAHVRVRGESGDILYDNNGIKNDKQLQDYVRFVWRKSGISK